MVNTKQMIEEVRKIASENPDFTYGGPRCSYFGSTLGVLEGQCCIIGQAFKNLGVDTAKLLSQEEDDFSPSVEHTITAGIVDVDILSDKDLDWLSSVQTCQDAKWSWEDAVRYADGGAV